ncbi:ABC transporter ATP-binding protein [Nonomuraea phyllanthi]|uniref:ABC transporter ATP-binding protein n=1 Tax=Nonomuraea phyllanthi TaxID=2219224 RepID=UPI001885353A|nr:ATP-binding cassette domain-containing protein [Nonomuraea phyllanthi]
MLDAKTLTKRFGPVVALSDARFAVRPGAITGLLGADGAGKSTTLRLFLGLVRPTSGSALIDGRPIHEWPAPARKVGAVLDVRSAHPSRRVIDSVRWAARLAGMPRSRAETVLDLVGLGAVAGQRARRLPAAPRRRLALATALAGDPETVLLDEPLDGLDPQEIAWLKELLRRLRGQGRTVLLTSRLLAGLEDLVDDLVVISRGRIVGSGSATAFVDRFRLETISVLSDRPRPLCAAVIEAGGEVLGTQGRRMEISGLTSVQLGEIARGAGIALMGLVEVRPGTGDPPS